MILQSCHYLSGFPWYGIADYKEAINPRVRRGLDKVIHSKVLCTLSWICWALENIFVIDYNRSDPIIEAKSYCCSLIVNLQDETNDKICTYHKQPNWCHMCIRISLFSIEPWEPPGYKLVSFCSIFPFPCIILYTVVLHFDYFVFQYGVIDLSSNIEFYCVLSISNCLFMVKDGQNVISWYTWYES